MGLIHLFNSRLTVKGFDARGTRSGFKATLVNWHPGFSLRSNPGLKLANAFGVLLREFKLSHYPECYSFRSAVVGSSPAARRAGRNEASTAITMNSSATETNVTGSVGLTSRSMLASTRVNPNDASRPMPMPIALRKSPFPTIKRKMRYGAAPSAMRTPISAVR